MAAAVAMCRARGCRYASTHTTSAHRCGTCHVYGHGQMECGRTERIAALRGDDSAQPEEMPEEARCGVRGCAYAWSHSTEAHHCFRCGVRGDGEHACARPLSPPLFPATNARDSASASASGGGAGGGAAAPAASDDTREARCPHCMQVGEVNLAYTIYTASECSVCYEAGPCVVFSPCRHATVCATCARKMKVGGGADDDDDE